VIDHAAVLAADGASIVAAHAGADLLASIGRTLAVQALLLAGCEREVSQRTCKPVGSRSDTRPIVTSPA
jgi:hypothetical protein